MNLWLLGAGMGEGWGEGIVREFGLDMYTLLYLKWITNKVLLYCTGTSVQCYVAAWLGEEFGGEWIHVYVWLSTFAVHLASPTRWTWVWVNSGSWWWTGMPGVLQFMGLQRVGYDWATELNWTETITALLISYTSIQNKKFFFFKETTATTVYFMHFLYFFCVLPPHLMWTHPKFHDSVLCLAFSVFILPQRPPLLPLSGSLYEELET